MDRYIVVVPHTEGECAKALKQVEAIGAITHFDWGCADGNHTGWVIIEAESKGEAMMVVPSYQRHTSYAVKLTKFSPEDIRQMHIE